jgi:hypothetical protein
LIRSPPSPDDHGRIFILVHPAHFSASIELLTIFIDVVRAVSLFRSLRYSEMGDNYFQEADLIETHSNDSDHDIDNSCHLVEKIRPGILR